MNLAEYQQFVKTSAYKGSPYWYACLGLAGETGEVIEIVKKLIRDKDSKVTKAMRTKVKLEMGDVLWYLGRLAQDFDLTLPEILEANVNKLEYRRKHGKKRGR